MISFLNCDKREEENGKKKLREVWQHGPGGKERIGKRPRAPPHIISYSQYYQDNPCVFFYFISLVDIS